MADLYESRHTGAVIDDAVDRAKSGGDIDRALAKKVNQNFFDNPLFQVNQRGFSGQNTSGGYFLDRFTGYNCSYTDGVLKIRKGMFNESANGYIIQRVEPSRSNYLNGKLCTFSAIVNGDLICGTATYSNTSEVTYTNENGVRLYTQVVSGLVELAVVTDQPVEKAILALKLELGDQQTLAHQDADGNWVLNEIPDYLEQLMRCQRYFNVIRSVSVNSRYGFGIGAVDNICVFVPINVPLRAVPSISMDGDFLAWNGVTPYPAAFRAFDSIATNGVTFSVTSSDMTAGQVFQLLDAGTGNSAIILDANL